MAVWVGAGIMPASAGSTLRWDKRVFFSFTGSANFPCRGKAIVLYYIHNVMLDNTLVRENQKKPHMSQRCIR